MAGYFRRYPIGLKDATPAQVLEHILVKKWALDPDDKDMLVMWHKFIYRKKGAHSIHLSDIFPGGYGR